MNQANRVWGNEVVMDYLREGRFEYSTPVPFQSNVKYMVRSDQCNKRPQNRSECDLYIPRIGPSRGLHPRADPVQRQVHGASELGTSTICTVFGGCCALLNWGPTANATLHMTRLPRLHCGNACLLAGLTTLTAAWNPKACKFFDAWLQEANGKPGCDFLGINHYARRAVHREFDIHLPKALLSIQPESTATAAATAVHWRGRDGLSGSRRALPQPLLPCARACQGATCTMALLALQPLLQH